MEENTTSIKVVTENGPIVAELVNWSEDLVIQGRNVIISSRSWKPEPLMGWYDRAIEFNSPEQFAVDLEHKGRKSPCGRWAFANTLCEEQLLFFPVEEWSTEEGTLRLLTGSFAFDWPVVIPVLYGEADKNTNRLTPMVPGARTPWMSYIPTEVVTQRPQVEAARGRVVIGGLGMGWFLDRVAAKPEVTEVVVVEHSRSLLEWYGKDLVAQIAAKYGKPVSVVHADVYAHMQRERTNNNLWLSTVYLLDIWPLYRDAMHDRRLFDALLTGADIHAWGLADMVRKHPQAWLKYVKQNNVPMDTDVRAGNATP